MTFKGVIGAFREPTLIAGALLVAGPKQDGRKPGTFAKGQSGNPAGRAKKTPEILEIEALAKSHAPDAMRAIAKWAKQSDNPAAAVKACEIIFDRAFGKARTTGELTIKDERMVVEAPKPAKDAETWVGEHGPH